MTTTIHRTDGLLDLRFSQVDGRTSDQVGQTKLTVLAQRPPLRVIRAFPLDGGGVLTHLHNVSGGVLGGDQLTVCVGLEESTQVQLTSTGATRVYRHRAGYADATQSMQIKVGKNALLEYLPDPLIPFADARFQQQTQIDLAEGAGLFYWEVIAPGREAHDERFAYDRIALSLDISTGNNTNNTPIVLERICLQPAMQPLTSTARMNGFCYFGTFYICKVGLDPESWLSLEQDLMRLADSRSKPGDILWGVSTMTAHGLTIRALSMTNRAITDGLLQFWRQAKQVLYGTAAIPPRKVY